MTTLARSLLRNRAEADDAVADALVRIHDAGRGFRGERGVRTWALRIVANLCRDRLRRRKFDAADQPGLLERAGLTVDPVAGWDERMDRAKALEAVERALAALPPKLREAVVTVHRLGLSHAEAAEVLGISEGNLRVRLHRGREALKRELQDVIGEVSE